MKNTVFAFGCVASAFVLTGCNSDPNVLLG
ncbi:hypothetical protein N474_01650 [Pseudoalteromonas luteoviolacea CPMOR-2]|nr:hypothetical protein N474_01650 [Pseudoalteromonas luteoviolacea CPMOR-2]